MPLVAKLDDLGKPAWIALMILSFIWWWPLGLAILALAKYRAAATRQFVDVFANFYFQRFLKLG